MISHYSFIQVPHLGSMRQNKQVTTTKKTTQKKNNNDQELLSCVEPIMMHHFSIDSGTCID